MPIIPENELARRVVHVPGVSRPVAISSFAAKAVYLVASQAEAAEAAPKTPSKREEEE